MKYLLILLLVIVKGNNAQQTNSKIKRTSDSFDVNISAGYGVENDYSSEVLPKSTTKIIRSENEGVIKPPRNVVRSVREPRILNNSTPLTSVAESESKSENRIYDFTNFDSFSASNSVEDNNLGSYKVHESFKVDGDFLKGKPNLIQLQKVISGLDHKQPHSKIVEVIKVPAVYEIHLQSDNDKAHKNSNDGLGKYATGGLLNYGKSKPIFEDFSTTKFADNTNWLEDFYKNKKGPFIKESEEYHDHFPNLSEYGSNFDDSHLKFHQTPLHSNDVLEPILQHHFKQVNNFEKKQDNVGKNDNTEAINKLRYASWKDEDQLLTNNREVISSKRNVGISNYKLSPTSFTHVAVNKSPEPKKTQDYYKDYNVGMYNKPSSSFIRNEEIAAFSKPQALHEVPAPYLGKEPHPKLPQSETSTKLNGGIALISSDNKSQPSSPSIVSFSQRDNSPNNWVYGKTKPEIIPSVASIRPSSQQLKTEVVPSANSFMSSIKRYPNFIYGKHTEPVLSPNEITTVAPATTQGSLEYAISRPSYEKNRNTSVFPSMSRDESNIQNYKIVNLNRSDDQTLRTANSEIMNEGYESINKKSDRMYRRDYGKNMNSDRYADTSYYSNGNRNAIGGKIRPSFKRKNSIVSIFPKKAFNNKMNLLQSEYYVTDFGKNKFMYNDDLGEDVRFPLSKNIDKPPEPMGYVVYIKKKSLV